jgi:hypothetical protein
MDLFLANPRKGYLAAKDHGRIDIAETLGVDSKSV